MEIAKAFVITGTCGAGKTTLVEAVVKNLPWVQRVISHTTRVRYKWERYGREYFFVSNSEYRKMLSSNALIGCSECYGNQYGASISEVNKIFSKGNCALFVPDIQGAVKIKEKFNRCAIIIFVMAPNLTELRKRMVRRGTDSPKLIDQKMEAAKEELKTKSIFDYTLVNDNFRSALCELKRIIRLHAGR